LKPGQSRSSKVEILPIVSTLKIVRFSCDNCNKNFLTVRALFQKFTGKTDMNNKAYSALTLKMVDADKRIIEGMATTPTPDRVGDVVEPKGVKFANPLPLLYQHRADQPVGHAVFDTPTDKGISFKASFAKVDEPGPLKDRIDLAWQEVKAGLIRGVSIGFRELEIGLLKNGGVHFLETEVLELSLVTIPANAEATISNIKSFDTSSAAIGKDDASGERPAVRAKRKSSVALTQGASPMSKSPAEQRSAFEATRAAKAARMEELQQKASDEGRTKDEAEKQEFDTIADEIKSIDSELADLVQVETLMRQKAAPVSGGNADDAGRSRGNGASSHITVREAPNLPAGIPFARVAKCLALAQGNRVAALEIAKERYPDHTAVQRVLKTAVAAGTVSTDAWAGALVGDETSVFADFVDYLRPLTVIGQFGAGGIPSLRRVPFRTPLISQSTGGTGYWVGEGQAKPTTKFDFARTTLEPYKAAGIAVLTMEVIRDSNPSAEMIVRDQLAQAVQTRLDLDFLDPQKGLVSGVSPASISNGLTPINSSGRDADSIRADLVAVFAAYIAANNKPSTGVWVMSAITALQLSLMTNALGQPEFPGVAMTGGQLQGLPIITSEHLGYTTDSPTEGRDVFLVNAGDVYLGDDGGMSVDMSTEASLQMDDAPTVASGPTVAATSLVSMFQTNSVAFRAERTISWKRRRTEGVVHLAQVEWGEASGVNV
jgi:HK97 family phage major capsid protein/HK97 family phage prohead protease